MQTAVTAAVTPVMTESAVTAPPRWRRLVSNNATESTGRRNSPSFSTALLGVSSDPRPVTSVPEESTCQESSTYT